MKTPLVLLALIACGFLVLAFTMYGPDLTARASQDVTVNLTASSSLAPEERRKNACYVAAEAMKAAGLPSRKQVMRKEIITVLPADLTYDTYASEKGSECALLNLQESNASEWKQNGPTIAGCICELVIPIKD